jgi:hypothetical protein
MSFLSRLFEPANVKNHRLAAEAAHRLRHQVFVNLDIEMGLLSGAYAKSTTILNRLIAMHHENPADDVLVPLMGNIRNYRDDVEAFFERVAEVVSMAKGQIDPKVRDARTASDFASVTQDEIDFREALAEGLKRAHALVETSNEVLTAPLSRLGPDARREFFGGPMTF